MRCSSLPRRNIVGIKSIKYVEFYVGNATQAAFYYHNAFGFEPVAIADLKTGDRERTSIIVRQNDVNLVLTSALSPDNPIAEFVKQHGDSVRDVALTVDDAQAAFEQSVKHGAIPLRSPTRHEHNGTSVVTATVGAYGDLVHTFIQQDQELTDWVLPGYQKLDRQANGHATGLAGIDHVALCVEATQLGQLVNFYERAFGFQVLHQEGVVTQQSAMNSEVVQNQDGKIKFSLMEPRPNHHTSQIQEYLTFHRGPGVQHIALLCHDIVDTVRALRTNGVGFLRTPHTYYDALENRLGKIEEDQQALRDLGILVDRDQSGLLFQIFTMPLYARPTAFMEIIERKGSHGFGSGNIKALFEAVELEQAARGTLKTAKAQSASPA